MMRLSEAIRLGAMMKPQGGAGTGNRNHGRTCAFGAAKDAVGSDDHVTILWPWLSEIPEDFPCPICKENPLGSYGVIPHMNNDHRLTREAIANIVEGWEKELEQKEQKEIPHETVADRA